MVLINSTWLKANFLLKRQGEGSVDYCVNLQRRYWKGEEWKIVFDLYDVTICDSFWNTANS